MNRRDSLKALGLIAAGSSVIAGACKADKTNAKKATVNAGDKLPGVQDFEHERTQELLDETFFTEHEMATITVLADIIIPKDEISGSASEAGVPAFIEFMVKDIPSNQVPMRGGLRWLDIQSQKRFSNPFIKCKKEEQLAFVDDIAYPEKAKPEMMQGVAFFSILRNFTTSGFFTTKMGINDLGYVGNIPGIWQGVPPDVLRAHGFESDNLKQS
ncbi:gluconate 2-dehydrogenase subunit 3 family protein [Sphingobacterium hotanense]|uniref:gluconate 2-dehydrogenase subunit 3 family protein n=1 Tax=Sphingobacterium hotanense TaxID=649196 RepID=UPI0011F2C204|nr:gluconate 2-dehydrogenase subunit 3 family protein [Sphingobacterium hotanense]